MSAEMRFSARRFFAYAWKRALMKAAAEVCEGVVTVERFLRVARRYEKAADHWERLIA